MNLTDLTIEQLSEFAASIGEKPFRGKQIFQWLWHKGADSFEDMTNISKALRQRLAQESTIIRPDIHTVSQSRDGTVKFLLRLADGKLLETVLIPGKDRFTQCVSTQVGCAMACTFCNTGQMGLERNLTRGEIVNQLLLGRRYVTENDLMPLKNIVFMGMGEPLMNLPEVLPALDMLRHPEGLAFSARRMTVSTVGFPDKLKILGQAGAAMPAISLHAPTQELRARIMPKAARVPLDELMAALDAYPLKPRERITYEYLLLRGVNDSLADARNLVRLLGHRRCKVNLIAYNPTEDSPYQAPAPEAVLAFEDLLRAKNLTATIRKSMGQDIKAACGQLKAKVIKK